MTAPTRRITLDLRRWPLRATFGVRPTVIVDGRSEPAQWGVGTWLIAADRPIEVTVFMFAVGIRFGVASFEVSPTEDRVEYRAPLLPFLRGTLRGATSAAPR